MDRRDKIRERSGGDAERERAVRRNCVDVNFLHHRWTNGSFQSSNPTFRNIFMAIRSSACARHSHVERYISGQHGPLIEKIPIGQSGGDGGGGGVNRRTPVRASHAAGEEEKSFQEVDAN